MIIQSQQSTCRHDESTQITNIQTVAKAPNFCHFLDIIFLSQQNLNQKLKTFFLSEKLFGGRRMRQYNKINRWHHFSTCLVNAFTTTNICYSYSYSYAYVPWSLPRAPCAPCCAASAVAFLPPSPACWTSARAARSSAPLCTASPLQPTQPHAFHGRPCVRGRNAPLSREAHVS